jgi:L-lactate utilization protein LutC
VSDQEEMLTRIRRALRRPPEGPGPAPPPAGSLPELGPVMPAIAASDLLTKFEAELTQVGGHAHRAASLSELDQVLAEIASHLELGVSSNSAGTCVVLSRNPLLVRLGLAGRLGKFFPHVATWPAPDPGDSEPARHRTGQDRLSDPSPAERESFKEQCFQAAVGITGVDLVLAESGTLVLSSVTEGSQLASLAPPIHVALYRRAQMVASLEEVLETNAIARSGMTSQGRSVVLITGTSRTADIEQVLIRGVHGPREVHAVLVEESCLG